MEILKHTAKIREYCDYIDEHVANVKKAWEALQVPCKNMAFIYDGFRWFSINDMVLAHDLSKVSPEEFIQYQQFFFPVGDKPGPPKEAFQHHYEANPHHWENWTKTEYYNPYEAECHCVCMVIDWMAMGYKFGDTAESYYLANQEKIELPEWAVKFIKEIFAKIAGAGEEA